MIRREPLRHHLVGMLGALLPDRGEAGADLDALHRVDSHHRRGEVGVEAAVDRLAPSDRHALRDRGDARAAGIARLPERIHETLEFGNDRRVGREERIGVDVLEAFERNRVRPDLRQVAADGDPVALAEPLARDRARGDAHRGLAGRRSAAAAVVADAVLLPVRVVGVAGSERVRDIRVVPAPLVLVADQERDRRPGRAPLEHAGQDLDRVRLASLRDVARRARTATVEVALDVVLAEREAGRTAVDDAADRGSVRFAERRDAEQLAYRIAGHGKVGNDEFARLA